MASLIAIFIAVITRTGEHGLAIKKP